MKIGIPRALFYWKKPFPSGVDKGHFWETFFKELGIEVILSPETNKEIVEKGVKVSDPETCFSNKVFWGHLLWLDGKCDKIFVPRLKTNKEKLEYCPKFFGLPDLAKILIKTKILAETFDERKEKFEKTLIRLGRKLNKNAKEIKKATEAAFWEEEKLREKQKKDFLEKIQAKKTTTHPPHPPIPRLARNGPLKIVLVSHPYNLYDEYVNLKIKEKLEKLGAQVIFINEVPVNKQQVTGSQQQVDWPKFHWEFGKEIEEKVETILNYEISGAVEISSFQCGCDAVLKEFIEAAFKKNKIPFLYLIIDENTGEAGFQTRLEAFMDTLH